MRAVIHLAAINLPALCAALVLGTAVCPPAHAQDDACKRSWMRAALDAGDFCISADQIRALLGVQWTDAQAHQSGWFDTDAVLKAAAAVPPQAAAGGDSEWREMASPWMKASSRDDHTGGLRLAVTVQDWKAAESAFDATVASGSPDRANAAYDAARAALDAGDVADGIRRLGALFADPADADTQAAAHHLLGTLSTSGSAPVLAARLAEISHLLTAPDALRAVHPDLARLVGEAHDDLAHLEEIAFPTDHFRVEDWDGADAEVFRAVGTVDPLIDLLRIEALPSPYTRLWRDPFYPAAFPFPGYALADQQGPDDPAALVARPFPDRPSREQQGIAAQTREIRDGLAYARAKAAATGNPLWAAAMARLSADTGDLPLIRRAERSALAGNDVPAARQALAVELKRQEVRILLLAERPAEAMQAGLREPRDDDWRAASLYLLGHGDLVGARAWAAAGAHSVSWDDSSLDLMLATSWQEVLRPGIGPRPDRGFAWRRDGVSPATAALLDLLPADRLVALSRTPGLRAPWRRPILEAAWIRDWMLGRDVAFEALLPEVRALVPETAADLDAIDHAWLPWTRRRLVVRMLLRLPGLSPRVLWNQGTSRWFTGDGRHADIRAIDVWNTNDGNWWCPLDRARAQRDAFLGLTSDLTSAWEPDPAAFSSIWASGDLPAEPSVDALATRWLDVFPLTQEEDGAELDALSHVPSGPARLTRMAVAWARHSNIVTRWLGWDAALPETLALAVRSTRYGCRIAGPLGPASHAAWVALQAVAPHSGWAERTPYWFDEK